MQTIVGIDFGGMSAKAGLFRDGAFVAKKTVETSETDSPAEIAEKLAELVHALAAQQGADRIDAVGIGSPGVIDSAAGTVVFWGNYHWSNVPLGAMVAEGTHAPVFVTNDASAAALGEAKYGSGKAYASSILVTIGTGIGGGVILNGTLFEGFRGAGTEIGHTVIVKDGIPCGCGRRGCFEQYASTRALIRLTKEKMQTVSSGLLWQEAPTIEAVGGRTAFAAAKRGDVAAREVVDAYIEYLSEGIANLVNVLRPQAVLIGGGISNEGEALLAPLRTAVERKLYVSSTAVPLAILKATLGNEAGMYGAASYAAERQKG